MGAPQAMLRRSMHKNMKICFCVQKKFDTFLTKKC